MGKGHFMIAWYSNSINKNDIPTLEKKKNVYFSTLNFDETYNSRCNFLKATCKPSVFISCGIIYQFVGISAILHHSPKNWVNPFNTQKIVPPTYNL